jgi:ribose 5-phosphate isomerase B
VTVIREGATGDPDGLAPMAAPARIALGSDHSGLALRRAIRDHLRRQGKAVQEVGLDTPDPVDYPDIAGQVARLVARREADAGIVIDGAGLGSAIAANKIHGIRAAMCTDRTLARYAREHNGANVLALGATLLGTDAALAIVDTWVATPMTEARYIRRLGKIQGLERTQ